MHARVTISEGRPDKTDEGIGFYQEVVGLLEEKEGFRGAYLLTNRETGKAISITLWDREADARATEASGWYQEQVDKLDEIDPGASDSGPEYYEVSVQR